MQIAVIYATTEGQTRKVARFVADRLVAAGHAVELLAAADAEDLALGRFAGAILAASVHAGHFQREFEHLVTARRDHLAALPTLFLAVSLVAAGTDDRDRTDRDGCVSRLCAETGWTPGRVEHVAGAFRFSHYDFFKGWAMRWIASQRGVALTPGEDLELTDWDALAAAVDGFAAGLRA
jgi:menaquinone-dependent protoporphyrinogen oxidase